MSRVLDRRSRPLRDLRISVTDRCNFRCTYCMPKEVFGRDFAFLPRARAAHVRGDHAARAGVRGARACPRSASPAASRCCAATSSGWSRCSRAIDGITDVALTTNGSALARQGAVAQGRRPDAASRSASTRSTTTRSRAMNDVGFPVARVLAGIDAAAAAGLRRSRSTWSSSAASTTTASRRWPTTSAARGHILRFIEYMDVGTTNGWRMDDVVPRRRDRRGDRRALAARAARAELPRRGRRPLPLPRRRRRDRRDRLGHAAVLRRAARARGCRPTASSTPACSRPRATTFAALLRERLPAIEDSRETIRSDLGPARGPLLRAAPRADSRRGRRSRCPTSAADRSRPRETLPRGVDGRARVTARRGGR